MPVVELLDLERIIAHRAWPYERVVEFLDAREAAGEEVRWVRLLACDIYKRPDAEALMLLASLLDQPQAVGARYSTLLAECATRPDVARIHLPGLVTELERFQRVRRALRLDATADVRAMEETLAALEALARAGGPYEDVVCAAGELEGAYRAAALAVVLESAIASGQSDDEVLRVLDEYLDHEVEPMRRVLATLDACRARDEIASRRLQPLVSELGALEMMLRSAYRHQTAREEGWRFPRREGRDG